MLKNQKICVKKFLVLKIIPQKIGALLCNKMNSISYTVAETLTLRALTLRFSLNVTILEKFSTAETILNSEITRNVTILASSVWLRLQALYTNVLGKSISLQT